MKLAAAFILFLLPTMMFSQSNNESTDKHALEEAQIRRSEAARPLIIFITANWCSYCRLMKKKVFGNANVATKIESGFYFAELNGGYTKPIKWEGKTYWFAPTGAGTGTHELAFHLGAVNGKLSYPTMVILDENNQVLYRYSGYLKSHELLELLGHFKK
ncbi:thioredoxin fold domain-containing protein [Marnyiella aurantia]|uniref:Thioredoxin fold domain-containing protein n=1 Tax=Marnyiella aurantia TaxID=2758037 RepID=A0A7D7QZL1_9FLAO|nr:thioredoxin fold domain-containing protein [Marnyiella aurantia]MBA5245639.1 thioredoxin fold domain-containing protein [Marnyiella aurantia]QMS98951.1 thioredoxin fold domain-containing protein [Marnyiella aurantia]